MQHPELPSADYPAEYAQPAQLSSYPPATFGAEPSGPAPLAPEPILSGLWLTVRMRTPQWMKEAATITAGVFGAMTLFRIFQRKLPKPQ